MAGWPRVRPRLLVKPAILAACLSASGCQSTFLTSAANAFGARISTLAMSETDERALGAASYQDILRTTRKTAHPEYQVLVETVGRRIADVSGRSDFDWEFTCLEGTTQNAFCLPGGKVVVYEGLLPVCENEAGLAVVMSHEIAHAVARHGAERMKEQAVVDAVGEVVSKSVSSQDEQRQLLLETAYGMGSKVGVLLPFSRAQESQADSIGLMLMAKAGYNPEEAPLFWRRFQTTGKGRTPELLSTHPADERRASQLVDLLPQAERFYAAVEQKLDRGSAIADLTNRTRSTVAKVEAAAPAGPSVPPTAFAPTALAAEPPQTPPPTVEQAAWIGAPPTASTTPATASAAPPLVPSAPASQQPDSGDPFLAPAAQAAPVDDKGWAPTAR